MVLDTFADSDTRRLAARWGRTADLRACEAPLRALLRGLPPPVAAVYGSGADRIPALVRALGEAGPLCGNPPAVLSRLLDPRAFFAALESLGIACPETRFEPPSRPSGWLLKAGCSEGGKGVRFAEFSRARPGDYWQRHIEGRPMSLLFLADGASIRSVGCNLQHTVAAGEYPYLYAGCTAGADISPAARVRLEYAAAALTRWFGLKGLNGIDFIDDGSCCRVVELNPRPVASMALYDADWPCGLLAAHLAACRGVLPERRPAAGSIRTSRLLYAAHGFVAPPAWLWPEDSADVPVAGSRIEAGMPVLTLYARGETAIAAEARLAMRLRQAQLLIQGLIQGRQGLAGRSATLESR